MSASPGPLAGLRDRDLAREGLVVAEGRLVVERLLAAASFEPLELRCVPALAERFSALAAGRLVPVVATEEETARLVGYPFHRGVIAVARRPPARSLSSLLAALAPRPRSALLLLPETRDAENLGALVRSAAALGLDGALLGPLTADILSRRSLRVSMGAALSLPWVRLSGPGGLEEARGAGYLLHAAVTEAAGAVEVDAWEPPPRCVIALGEEYAGLGEGWLAAADGRVTIPMAPGPDSLNVAAAGAILMRRAAAGLVPGRGPG